MKLPIETTDPDAYYIVCHSLAFAPAFIIGPDERVYTFLGGYGNDDRTLTQQGCALVCSWLDQHACTETHFSLTRALDIAQTWHKGREAN